MSTFTIQLRDGYYLSVCEYSDKIEMDIFDSDDVWTQRVAEFQLPVTDETDDISIKLYLNGTDLDEIQTFTTSIVRDREQVLEEHEDVFSYGDTGEEVKTIQRRLEELGYFSGTIGGNYLSKTKAAVEAFQLANGLQVDGVCDEETYNRLFSEYAEPSESINPNEDKYAKEMDWWSSDIQKIFAKGVTATITDVDTGLTWQEQRRGGTNHADVQPLTREDTKNLKKAYGGKWAWTRRAIWVAIDGKTYAASMNGMPHGGSSIENNGFDGHHCIHFTNSRTHCSNKVCPNHQKMIKKAASVALK